ncbi:MAG: alpha/beta fold hydrolase [Candidatus Limnocylindrales bacterium]
MNLVLIHGSYFGAWCWDLVAPELQRLGHRVTAIDLPISERGVGASGYADAVIEGTDWSEPPVLVAHSMAGLVAPVVAARRPVDRLIFIAAFLPKPGLSALDQRAAEPIDPTTPPETAEWTDMGDGLWMVGSNTARELFMHDASEKVVAWALPRLRPQFYGVMGEVTPLDAWPDVKSEYIVCRDDRASNPDWGRTAARDRLGVAATEIDGSHSPMFSRPEELAVMLDELAQR